MSIAVSIVPKGFAEAEKALKGIKNGFPKAMANAINAGLRSGNALASNIINKRYNIKVGVIKSEIKVNKANHTKLEGQLAAKGPMLPVSLFSPKSKTRASKRRGPKRTYLMAAILRGKAKTIPGAFFAKGRVWERRPLGTSERDAPLGITSTIGVPFMIGYLGIAKRVQDDIAKTTEKRLAHEVQFALSKVRKPKL